MSLRVVGYGNTEEVTNPANPKQKTKLTNVIFEETGRKGVGSIAESSNALDQIMGKKTGLDQVRRHTQPVAHETLGDFPLDATIQGHINRELYSFPTIKQHEGRPPRMIDGQPTYFKTNLSLQAAEDVDKRIPNDKLIVTHPWLFTTATMQQADVEYTATGAENMANATGNANLQSSGIGGGQGGGAALNRP